MSVADPSLVDLIERGQESVSPKVILGGTPLLGRLTGIGRYTTQLARSLVERQVVADLKLWGDFDFLRLAILLEDNVHGLALKGKPPVKRLGGSIKVLREIASRSYWASRLYHQCTAAVAERRLTTFSHNYVYHSPNFILPRFDGAKVMTVHDLSVIRFPQFHRKQMVRLCESGIYSAISEGVHLIADSSLVKQELMRDFGIQSERIDVVHLAPDARCRPREERECHEVLDAIGVGYKLFFLSVGTLEPRKNLLRLFEAFKAGRARGDFDWPLVVVGSPGWKSEREHQILDELVKDGLAVYLSYVTDETLLHLYSAAGGLVFPSLYEGFGLPAIEATASGCPVLTSEGSAMVEFLPEGAELVDPEDVASISAGMKALVEFYDAGSDCDKSIFEVSRTWDEVALETCAAYRRSMLS